MLKPGRLPEEKTDRTEKIKVSVIIPCHNEQKHISGCLDSLLAQTFPFEEYELILVDDGSTDETVGIIKSFESANPSRLKVFQQPHGGPALARNLGAKEARGEILAFLDSDMKFAPDFLEKLVQPIEKGETIGTFTLDEFVANNENKWSRGWNVCYYLPPGRRVPEDLKEEEGTVFRAIQKSTFFKVGGFDSTGYHDDHSLSQKLNLTAKRVNGAICYHYNPDSLGDVFASAHWIGKSEKQSTALKEWLRRTPPGSLKRGIARAIQEKEPFYIIFDQVYSFGILSGMVRRKILKGDHSR